MSLKIEVPAAAPLTLCVGKSYVRRNGEVVRVLCTDRPHNGGITVVTLGKDGDISYAYSNGKQFEDGREHCLDLVSEHKEPEYHYANVYKEPVPHAKWYESQKQVIQGRSSYYQCLGMLKINMEDFSTTFEPIK